MAVFVSLQMFSGEVGTRFGWTSDATNIRNAALGGKQAAKAISLPNFGGTVGRYVSAGTSELRPVLWGLQDCEAGPEPLGLGSNRYVILTRLT